ncbi:hypothetical protein [Halorubrum lipolyticum]|uniref:hypothetical protein n=1 Tax=Halorubrum lipolyticum TaxID=368624 RepID=UPI0011CA3B14|nr:hypothetical protein [Halorubrum lipolyticum]
MIWVFRFTLHQRPVAQYVFFGGFAGFIGYQIAGGASRSRVIPQILVLSFLTFWSVQFLFPAGMFAIDTYYGYIPQIEGILRIGYYDDTGAYMGHLIHTGLFARLTGFDPQTAYFVLATSLLTGTILVLSILDRALSALSREVALFAALIFSISSWTIGRGMHPNKLNYFYPLIVLFGITAIHLYKSGRIPKSMIRRWFIAGIAIIPAVVFGHRFSAGAALLLLFAIFGYAVIARRVFADEYDLVSRRLLGPFVAVYFLAVIGNPLHQGPLAGRLSSLITSIVIPSEQGGGSGGPGRFSELAIDVLIASTAAQTIVFALAVIGSIWMFQRRKWEYDLVLFWLVCLGALLAVALLRNSVDTAPQRFYGVLMLFGFNIAIAVAFDVARKRELQIFGDTSINWSRLIVTSLVVLLAVSSLASPIAERATSPVSDEIPDIRQFDTNSITEGDQWSEQYAVNESRIVAPTSDVPIDRISPARGVANRTGIGAETLVVYSEWSHRRGVGISGGLTIGGRTYVFVPSPERPSDNRVYQNGGTTAFYA